MTGIAADLGVVTLAHGRHDHLRRQLSSLAAGDLRPAVCVVVAMADPGIGCLDVPPGLRVVVTELDCDVRRLPLAAARNLGMRVARDAGCRVLVGLDVDCLAGSTLVGGYASAVRAREDVVWSGPVTYLDPPPPTGYPLRRLAELDAPHPARPAPAPGQSVEGADPDLFWSLSYALSGSAWEASGGFDEAYVGYGAEDTDFGRRVERAGLGLGWVGAARAYHQHHATSSPPVEHLDDILRNGRLFADRWGRWPMTGWLEEFARLGLVEHTAAGGWRRA